jgi:nitrite reductase/ring-hydroxylating ferredoxin subunit
MIFNKPPKILAHRSSTNNGNFVTNEYILNNGNAEINLFHRNCPHRLYPMGTPGEVIENIVCKFHGFEWDKNGQPLNNDRNIGCGKAQIGRSGLVFKDFTEPDHAWVDILETETELEYSHSMQGNSTGSWIWMLDIQADLLHIRKGNDVVHPGLASVTNLDDVSMEEGDGWVLQMFPAGFWLVIYPFTFIEWSPGCLAINSVTPNDADTEFGFKWITQFYYTPKVLPSERSDFETLEDVFWEDVRTVEQQVGKYFPLMKAINRLEDHCIHFGKWVSANKSN